MKSKNGLAWEEKGKKDAGVIILIHGFPFNRSMWKTQVDALSKAYRVVSLDVRGHGQSVVGDGQYTIELFVDDLLQLMDYLKIKKAILCGLSMGGYIALRAAERHPDRVSGLVLCDTKSEADGNEAKIKRAASLVALKKHGVRIFSKSFLKNVFYERTFKENPDAVRLVSKMITANSIRGISGTLLALAARTDTTASLPQIKVPTLVLVGKHDILTPPKVGKKMAQAIRGAEFFIVPDAAHMSNLENPEFFNVKLFSFLKKHF